MNFRGTVTGTRDDGTGIYVEGEWVAGSTTVLSIEASIQPLRPDEMDQLPEGRRSGQAYKLYTDDLVRTAKQDQYNADKLTINGEECEVVAVKPYQSGIISHYKVFAVRIS